MTPETQARRNRLPAVIERWAPKLQEIIPPDLNATALLTALAWQESLFGILGGRSRVEPGYRPKGAYYREHVLTLYDDFGDAAASSWSSWQVMYPTAWELGFRAYPWDLRDDGIAVAYVLRYIDRRAVQRGAVTVEKIARAYNSGTHEGPETDYMRRVRRYYDKAVAALAAHQGLDTLEV